MFSFTSFFAFFFIMTRLNYVQNDFDLYFLFSPNFLILHRFLLRSHFVFRYETVCIKTWPIYLALV